MPDLHPQDWILIVEALVQWAGSPEQIETSRQERAYEIVEEMAIEQELPPDELLLQVDDQIY